MSKKTSQRNPEAALDTQVHEGIEFMKNNQTMILVLVAFLGGGIFLVTSQREQSQTLNMTSWDKLVDAEQSWKKLEKEARDKATPPFAEINERYPSSSAAPFALLQQAQTLYERGSKADLEAAKARLELFIQKYPSMALYHDLAREKLAAIKDELAYAPSWLPKKEEPKKEEPKKEEPKKEEPKKEEPKKEEPKKEEPKKEEPKAPIDAPPGDGKASGG